MRFSLHIHSSNINIDGPSPWIAISFLLHFPHVTGHNSNPRFPSVVFLLQYFFFPTFLHLSLKVFIFFDFFFLIFILNRSFVSSQVELGATVGVTEELDVLTGESVGLDVLTGESVGLDVLTGEVVGFCVGVFEVIQPSDESHVLENTWVHLLLLFAHPAPKCVLLPERMFALWPEEFIQAFITAA